jgi:hypothetical protein
MPTTITIGAFRYDESERSRIVQWSWVMDYSKINSEGLEEEIYRRQMMGIPDVLPRITRIFCRCCADPIVLVNLHWSDRYKPRQALPCLRCGHQPILTAAYSWRGGEGEWATKIDYWIECNCGPRQEFIAENLIPYPARADGRSSVTSQDRTLPYNLLVNGIDRLGRRSKPGRCKCAEN